MKNTFYFPHDYDSSNDDKILQMRSEFGVEGYGLWWMCLETMAKNQYSHLMATLLGGLSIGYGVTRDKLLAFLEYCTSIELLTKDVSGYYSLRMMQHKDVRRALSISGKQGADVRWKNSHPISHPNAKERKGKENKGKENIVSVGFAPPTLEEVTLYCTERTNQVNAQRFLDFYTSKGWMVGKNKMKDWRAAVRTWEAKEVEEKPDLKKSAERKEYEEKYFKEKGYYPLR